MTTEERIFQIMSEEAARSQNELVQRIRKRLEILGMSYEMPEDYAIRTRSGAKRIDIDRVDPNVVRLTFAMPLGSVEFPNDHCQRGCQDQFRSGGKTSPPE
jgi:hypothetical protein